MRMQQGCGADEIPDRKTFYGFLLTAIFAFLFLIPGTARAVCCDCADAGCAATSQAASQTIMDLFGDQPGDAGEDHTNNSETNQSYLTRSHWEARMQKHQLWFVNEYFVQYILPAMMRMTEQLSAVGMDQIFILGALLDAKHQMESERLFAAMTAKASRDYYPSEALCTIGSGMRSLAASERMGEVSATLLAQRALDRGLLNANANASEGPKEDKEGRIAQYLARYCDANDLNRGLSALCTASPQARRNKDIDYTKMIGNPLTLNVNFSDTTLTPDEEDVLALESNLYNHDVFKQVAIEKLDNNESNQQIYMNLRSIAAKRSVAEQSFQAIVGMKSAGSSNAAQTAKYLRGIMRDLGIATDAEADAVIGQNPSYYAQMELLTRKVFQNPDYIASLYDKPANVARRGVAAQAFNLMQSHDLYKSDLRTEALLAVLLEMEVMKEQDAVQKSIAPLAEGKD